MNQIQEASSQTLQSATTERKGGRRRRSQQSPQVPVTPLGSSAVSEVTPTSQSTTVGAKSMNTSILNANTHAKFVLFGIARTDLVDNGPVMRGFVEVKTEEGGQPVKINVAAWLKIGRSSGTEYLSLKVGNNSQEEPEQYSVGPFYGRLFRQVDGSRTRYFGFIEESEKTGEDENGQGTYATHWQIRVNAKPALSNDGKTRYIGGSVTPSQQQAETHEDSNLPF